MAGGAENVKEKGTDMYMENKEQICSLLLAACRETRYLGDMIALEYDSGAEAVTAIFKRKNIKERN